MSRGRELTEHRIRQAITRQQPENIQVNIGGIVFAITCDSPENLDHVKEIYQDFLCTGEPEITIRARYDGLPPIVLRDQDKIFDSEMAWSLYRVGDENIVVLKSPVSDLLPYRIAVFDHSFKHGRVFNRIPESNTSPNEIRSDPLEYPLAEILMICLLAQERGLMMHACGVDDNGRGYLFAGNSTHGKSTMARLWQDEALILNDDRIVLRYHEGRFWMYGTPWHGDYTSVSHQGVPLEKIFFLRHSETNHADLNKGVVAASMLLSRCFPPLWDERGMGYTLDFSAQLVQSVQTFELSFVPDKKILDFVRCVK